MMRRVPLRIRLTAIFAIIMVAVLTAAGYLTMARFAEAQNEYGPAPAQAQAIAQHEALADLRRELLTALPIVFVVATIGAYLLAAAALRPVERMRAQVAAVTEHTLDRRLEEPPSRDEIARLAVTLNSMLARLQAALERERQFVADAGHDLRTPLSLLRTEIELALRRPRNSAELRAALASAYEEVVRLIALAEDLLLLARTDHETSAAASQERKIVAVAPLLERLAARLDGYDSHGRVTISCPPTLTVHARAERIERALNNLLHNALHHGSPPVEISARAVDGHVEIRIRDHGPGFDETFLPHAFERFTRADAARTHGGTGLGLAITAALAHADGGTVHATNHHSGGAQTMITLPAAPNSSTSIAEAQPIHPTGWGSTGF